MNRAVVDGYPLGLPVRVPVTYWTRQTYPGGNPTLNRKRARVARTVLQRGMYGVASDGMNDEYA